MTLKKSILLIWLFWLGCVLYSLTLPYYTDPKAVSNSITEINPNKDLYYKMVEQYKTNKLDLMDFGSWLAIASVTILLFMIVMQIKNISDWKKLNTCSKKIVFVIANIAGLMMIPGTIWYYWFRLIRWDYPPFADTIIIPVLNEIPIYLIFLIPMNIFMIIATMRAHLPTLFFISNSLNTIKIWILKIIFGIILLINLLSLFTAIIDGDHFQVPFNLAFAYVILVLRAGNINSKNK